MLRIDSIKNESLHKELASMKMMGENSNIHSGDTLCYLSELVLLEALKALASDELLKKYKKAFARNEKAIRKVNQMVAEEYGINQHINWRYDKLPAIQTVAFPAAIDALHAAINGDKEGFSCAVGRLPTQFFIEDSLTFRLAYCFMCIHDNEAQLAIDELNDIINTRISASADPCLCLKIIEQIAELRELNGLKPYIFKGQQLINTAEGEIFVAPILFTVDEITKHTKMHNFSIADQTVETMSRTDNRNYAVGYDHGSNKQTGLSPIVKAPVNAVVKTTEAIAALGLAIVELGIYKFLKGKWEGVTNSTYHMKIIARKPTDMFKFYSGGYVVYKNEEAFTNEQQKGYLCIYFPGEDKVYGLLDGETLTEDAKEKLSTLYYS
jgi:hypothetical protein